MSGQFLVAVRRGRRANARHRWVLVITRALRASEDVFGAIVLEPNVLFGPRDGACDTHAEPTAAATNLGYCIFADDVPDVGNAHGLPSLVYLGRSAQHRMLPR